MKSINNDDTNSFTENERKIILDHFIKKIQGIYAHAQAGKTAIANAKIRMELKQNKAISISSYIAIIGVINVPIIKYSVDWWATLHQPSSINVLSESTIHSSMLIPLFLMTAAFALFSVLIFLMKYNVELIKVKNKGLNRI